MKIFLPFIFAMVIAASIQAQTNLITNGSFENLPLFTGWNSTNANGNLWGGIGSCAAAEGIRYIWLGDQLEATGVNLASENLYQTITIPSGLIACELVIKASINTLETGTTVYDRLDFSIRNTSGALLYSMGFLSNTTGQFGIPGCRPWQQSTIPIPATYYGQTVRISMDFSTDNTLPTIFRIDDIKVLAYSSCTYNVAPTAFTCPNSLGSTYSNIASISTASTCAWSANVTSGASWLSTTSSATGNGNLSINVTQNLGPARTGTINIGGTTITVDQPGVPCNYALSVSAFNCPTPAANSFSNVATVTAGSSCAWTAIVTSGSAWLSTSSSGTGNGSVSINVLQNTGGPRTGTIDIQGQTLTINQPDGSCTYSLSSSNFVLPDHQAGNHNNIALVNTQSFCSWTANVTSGTWLVSSSAGTGAGAVSIIVLANPDPTLRTGTIDVNGQILTVVQPGSPTGIGEFNEADFYLYPSPADHFLYIGGSSELTDKSYQIYSHTGEMVVSGILNKLPAAIEVSDLASGVYLIRIGDSVGITSRFVKN